jgi:hypothetical protein
MLNWHCLTIIQASTVSFSDSFIIFTFIYDIIHVILLHSCTDIGTLMGSYFLFLVNHVIFLQANFMHICENYTVYLFPFSYCTWREWYNQKALGAKKHYRRCTYYCAFSLVLAVQCRHLRQQTSFHLLEVSHQENTSLWFLQWGMGIMYLRFSLVGPQNVYILHISESVDVPHSFEISNECIDSVYIHCLHRAEWIDEW